MSSMPTLDFSGSPNAPIYEEEAAQAEQAYNTALANIATTRSNFYNTEGFKVTNNPDGSVANYSVDGTNLTGAYQQMERNQGINLEAQHEADMSRNLGAKGIGDQGESNMRYADDAQQAAFGDNFINTNEGYVEQQASAEQTLQNTLMELQMEAIADAMNGGTFPDDGGPGGSSPGGSTGGSTKFVGGGTQTKSGGIVVDSTGGYYDPQTSQYYPSGSGPAAKQATSYAKPANAYLTNPNKKG